MRFSLSWLKEWIDPQWDLPTLSARLTGAGLEVAAIEDRSQGLEGVVVAHVEAVRPHPDADRLRIVTVAFGGAETLEIVCGAPNVALGMNVPLAQVGATLPNGMKIKKGKIRGVVSPGMLCSPTELGLPPGEEDGLLRLPTDAVPGTPIAQQLGLDDPVVEIELTPNRGDCLSVRGVARELGALSGRPVTGPEIVDLPSTDVATVPALQIEDGEGCRRYALARLHVANGPSPEWIKRRLEAVGLRPRNILVDVTNYVLWELGQPLHAFDANLVSGGVTVRSARAGESFKALNDRGVALGETDLVITDERGAIALAGVMGGADSAVTDGTQEILLEAAWFTPDRVGPTARRHGLGSDSSHRFERGVDPDGVIQALARAVALLQAHADAKLLGWSQVDLGMPERPAIELEFDRLAKLLGMSIPDDEVASILERLGGRVTRREGGVTVIPPGHRLDWGVFQDLAEEVARVVGLDNIPNRLPQSAMRPAATIRHFESYLTEAALAVGGIEVITFPFIGREDWIAFAPEGEEPVVLSNPIQEDRPCMRGSLLPGLARSVGFNRARQQEDLRLVESGHVFRSAEEHLALGGVLCGAASHWSGNRPIDFFDLKGWVESVLQRLGVEAFTLSCEGLPRFLHPGRSGWIEAAGTRLGWLGQVHPALSEMWEGGELYGFELDAKAVESLAAEARSLDVPSDQPSMRRDLALWVDRTVAAADLLKEAQGSAALIRRAEVFDRFDPDSSGEKISLGLRLTFQAADRTLASEEVDQAVAKVLKRLENRFGAGLR